MAPGKPSDKALAAALAEAVREIYNSDEREQLSVNLVRQRVEAKFDLKDGFFKGDAWKGRSKLLIKNTVVSPSRTPARRFRV